MFIEGEAGIGKTRLIQEGIRRADEDGFAVLKGRSEELERMRPFGAIADALGDASELPASSGGLKRLLRPDPGDPGAQPLGEPVLIDAFVELVEELALLRPTCVVLEDLHWADPGTISAMRAVARRLHYLPILVVGTYRPHPQSKGLTRLLDTATREGAVEVRLRPLGDANIVALVESLLGASAAFARKVKIPGLARGGAAWLARSRRDPLEACDRKVRFSAGTRSGRGWRELSMR